MVMTEEKVVCPYCDGECEPEKCPKYLAYKKVQEPGAIEEMLQYLGVDPNQDPLTVMMGMQKAFALKFHPVDNLSKKEIDHWIKSYDICISDEHAEVLEHLGLIMNSDAKEDHYELQKEFIDIWHFLMDQFLVANLTVEKILEIYDLHYGGGVLNSKNPLKSIFINEYNRLNKHLGGTISNLSKDRLELEILIHSNKLLLAKSKVMKEISWKHWKKPSDTINFDKLHKALVDVFSVLVQCFILTGLNDEQLYNIYVTKNVENQWRQRFNY